LVERKAGLDPPARGDRRGGREKTQKEMPFTKKVSTAKGDCKKTVKKEKRLKKQRPKTKKKLSPQ